MKEIGFGQCIRYEIQGDKGSTRSFSISFTWFAGSPETIFSAYIYTFYSFSESIFDIHVSNESSFGTKILPTPQSNSTPTFHRKHVGSFMAISRSHALSSFHCALVVFNNNMSSKKPKVSKKKKSASTTKEPENTVADGDEKTQNPRPVLRPAFASVSSSRYWSYPL